MDIVFFSLLLVAVAVYLPISYLLFRKSGSQSLTKRSPILILVSHVGNFAEVLLLLITRVYIENGSSLLQKIFQAGSLFFHCLYYFPYLLRCYRLYFVFRLDLAWDQSDSFFLNRHRASQAWLVKVLVLLMVPIVITAVLILSIDSFSRVFPTTCQPESVESMSSLKLFYIAISFIEELMFIMAVWLCREVNDDFAMTIELTIVCALWFTNSLLMLWITKVSSWIITVVCRNCAIMCISSLWPLVSSFRKDEFGVPLTLEVLNNLELLLQNEETLDAFYRFLGSGQFYCKPGAEVDLPIVTTCEAGESEGHNLLDFWLDCEVYKHNPTRAKEAQIYADFIVTSRVKFSKEILTSTEGCLPAERFLAAQDFALSSLRHFYFPLFQQSLEYNLLLKEMNRQDIYLNRLTHTSFLLPASCTN